MRRLPRSARTWLPVASLVVLFALMGALAVNISPGGPAPGAPPSVVGTRIAIVTGTAPPVTATVALTPTIAVTLTVAPPLTPTVSVVAPTASKPTPTPVRWSAEKIKAAGERPIDPTGNAIFLGWSPDGGGFLFRKSSTLYRFARFADGTGSWGQFGDLWLMNADGAGRRKLADLVGSWAWSPDGQFVAYTAPAQGEGVQGFLYVVALTRFETRRLTASTFTAGSLFWLSTGEITFLRDSNIYAIKPDGSGERKVSNITITPPDQEKSGSGVYAVSRDGKKVSYVPSAGAPLWIANLDGTAATKVNDGDTGLTTWSPDSTKLVFVKFNPYHGTGYDSDLWAVYADGSGLRLVVKGATEEENEFPVWSPDSQVIAYIKRPPYFYDTRSGLPPPKSPKYEIWLVNQDGTNARRIIDDVARLHLHWSPRGAQMAFTREVAEKVDLTPATVKSVIIDLTAQ